MGKMMGLAGVLAALLLGAAFVRAEGKEDDPAAMESEKLVKYLTNRPEVVEAFKAKFPDWKKVFLAGNEGGDAKHLKRRLEGLRVLTEIAREKNWPRIVTDLERRAKETEERLGKSEGNRDGGEKGGDRGCEMGEKGGENGDKARAGGARELGEAVERAFKDFMMAQHRGEKETAEQARQAFGENLRKLVGMAERGNAGGGRNERVDDLRKQVDDLRKEMAEVKKLLGEVAK